MAREVVERLVDDLDGTPATATVAFSLDGVAYTIDLNTRHENELRARLGPFLEVARRVRATPRRAAGRTVGDRDRNAAIRRWALDEGVELPGRGRIAGAVQDAYDAKDVAALYAAAGLELAPAPRRSRRRSAPEPAGE